MGMSPELDAQPLRVMSYNIRYDNPGDGLNAWPVRRQALADQIKTTDPDIFGVQESLPHQVAWLADALPEYEHLGVGRDENGTGESTTIFFKASRFEVLTSGMFWLSDTPGELSKGWDAAIRRICTWVGLADKQSGKSLLMLNTHFDHVGEKAREQSANLIVKKIKELNTNHDPVILTGDFNATPTSSPIIILGKNLVEARTAIKTPSIPQPGSFNGFDSSVPAANLIDHIFVSSGISITNYRMLVEPHDGRYPSDHFPVVADLVIH